MHKSSLRRRRFLAPFGTATGKVQWLGLVLFAAIAFLALFAPLISAYGPTETACAPFQPPDRLHLFGCDDAGHDILAQVLYGGRVSLAVGLSVAVVSTLVATAIAIVAGFCGGLVDRVTMRLVDVVLSLPFLPLVIVLGVFFGASIKTQIIVIALVMWSHPVRELRAQILAIRASGFVEASLSMGASPAFVGLHHILPELMPLVVPQFVRIAHTAILVETSLSFLGLGDPLQTSWGSILFHANARTAFLTGAWVYWIAPPGIAVSLTVLSLAFIGFGYNGAIGPRLARRREQPTVRPAGATPEAGAAVTLRGLHVSYDTEAGTQEAVRGVGLALKQGELLGLVGESGSGKTTTALAVLRLLGAPARITAGALWLKETDLFDLDREGLRRLRGTRLSMVPQSAMNALNPVLTIGAQLDEALARRPGRSASERRRLVGDWLEKVGLSRDQANRYPHELSGGMRQRAVIAIAICNEPDIVVADEPTTGLDVLVQEEFMELLLNLRRSLGLSVLFVTHNLPLIARHADRLLVMYRGEIVDEGTAAALRRAPRHLHTRALFDSVPPIVGAKRWSGNSLNASAPTIELRNVSRTFHPARLWRRGTPHHAVQNVSLWLRPREKLGLVGGSGAGKTTIARLLLGVVGADSGTVLFEGTDIRRLDRAGRKTMRRAVHLVFQDPYQSMRNGLNVHDIVAEPLRIHGLRDAAAIEAKVRAALEAVRLPADEDFLGRLPVQLSGGQRQRVAFARAVVTQPKVIIADEPTSMLDQSIRMEMMDLMEDLRQRFGTAFLFITHDIALARHFCDRIMVLKDGTVVEEGPADSVVAHSSHAYTRRLVAAA